MSNCDIFRESRVIQKWQKKKKHRLSTFECFLIKRSIQYWKLFKYISPVRSISLTRDARIIDFNERRIEISFRIGWFSSFCSFVFTRRQSRVKASIGACSSSLWIHVTWKKRKTSIETGPEIERGAPEPNERERRLLLPWSDIFYSYVLCINRRS